jgi:transposase InsO family protein
MVIRAVQMAVWQRQERHSLILHSDRGSQFRSGDYQGYLAANGLLCSMGAVGHFGDNAGRNLRQAAATALEAAGRGNTQCYRHHYRGEQSSELDVKSLRRFFARCAS